MSFLHTIKKDERQILREVVKKVHLCHNPREFCTDYEADKMIASIGPEIVERMIRFGRDNIDRL
tara:strand:+ start:1970 stop:2161 length:192 start_codon:yes stop_codon:yes gene_type:complete